MICYRLVCILAVTVLSFGSCPLLRAGKGAALPIIPQPLQVRVDEGEFELGPGSEVCCSLGLLAEAEYLAARLRTATGYPLPVRQLQVEGALGAPGKNILLLSDPALDLGDEGYRLTVSGTRALIEAGKPAGAFYGVQTLLQLFPPEVMSCKTAGGVRWAAPAVRVEDRPRFRWRAYLLDEGRWFKGMETVKRMLDQMAQHKMNVFHWHLTDDQGWRIQIRRYPKLTGIGSRRKDTQVGGWGSEARMGKPHSGFYTREQIKEIVDYAEARHIYIVPEVEMPGHASAAIAAYPELGAAGREIEVPVIFGKMYDTFNVADEKVYTFLENVLEEVMELFPFEVVHLGGDEVRFDHWLASPQVRAFMEKEGLSGPAQLQLSFTNRMSWFLESRGRRMMGWNEILGDDLHGFIKGAGGRELKDEAGGRSLAGNAIVHFWKGSLELAERAAREGHDIVNSLHSSTYLDYDYQSIPLQKAYEFEPVPAGLDEESARHVLGSGCQMWGEWIPTEETLEYQTFPRLSAYAEVGWTAVENKDFGRFMQRIGTQLKRWEVQNITYGPTAP
ncbi:MAG: beta-N-acetylhexosaminidase [Candidatus Glassbacteria bacterium]|nr:beta-N-acetylhexosaminidase [Candidatus Glassbacteria bacterium]